MNDSTPAVQVVKLHKSFGAGAARVDVIRDLDFTLPRGAFEAVMGASGSGKSTLLHLVAALLAPDRGQIRVGGELVSAMSDREATVFRRRRIGLVFQDFNLVPTLTAAENIELPLLLDRARPDRAHVASLVQTLGLGDRLSHLPSQLSGGERQRVAVARALAGNPDVVLADEPTGNLDSPAAKALCGLLRSLNESTGCAILLVTHDPVTAAAASRVHLLKDGAFVGAFDTGHDPALVSERYLAAAGGKSEGAAR